MCPVDDQAQDIGYGCGLDRERMIRKRRSLGLPTDRDTWVRIEARAIERIDGQGWNGVEAAAVLHGVAMPTWFQGMAWSEAARGLMWRADETELVAAQPIKPGGILTVAPELSDAWWSTLNASLDALAGQRTSRIAGLRPITQERISATIGSVFPGVDTTIEEWTTAHADLAWANLTAPECYLLDWEDWGIAPRGYDSATLLGESLAVPSLADRVYQERRADLDTRSGTLALLFQCSKYISAGEASGPLLEPAKALPARLVSRLQE
jgi:hypothetical protein